MKKIKLIFLILLALSVIIFTSCDENEPEETNPTYPLDINRDRDRNLPPNKTPITDWDNVELGNIGWMSLTEGDGSYSYNMDFRGLGLNDSHLSTHAFRLVYFFNDINANGTLADVMYDAQETVDQWVVRKGLSEKYQGIDTAPWYEHNIGTEAAGVFEGNQQRVAAMLKYIPDPNVNEKYFYYFKGISEGYGETEMQLVGIEHYIDDVMIDFSGDSNLGTPYVPI